MNEEQIIPSFIFHELIKKNEILVFFDGLFIQTVKIDRNIGLKIDELKGEQMFCNPVRKGTAEKGIFLQL